jgi:hypothetical protein
MNTFETRNGIGGSRLVQKFTFELLDEAPSEAAGEESPAAHVSKFRHTHFRIGGRTPAQYQRQRVVSVYFILGNHFPLPILQAIDEVGNHSAARVDELVIDDDYLNTTSTRI